MKRMITICCVVVLALAVTHAPVSAQTGGFGIYGGLAMPNGDFGSTTANKAGFAKQGFGGGLEFTIAFPLDLPIGIGWITSFTGTYNDFDSKKAVGSYTGLKVDYTPWLIVWPMTGGAVSLSVSSLSVYGTLQIGGAAAMMPDVTVTSQGQKMETKADPVAVFPAFSIGGGVGLGPLRIGARYLDAGEIEFSVKESGTGFSSGTIKRKFPISVIMVTAGLEF